MSYCCLRGYRRLADRPISRLTSRLLIASRRSSPILQSCQKKCWSPFGMSLKVKPAESCQFDLVALGECMIRLSPAGHGRVEFAPTLEVWVGGGEYNVAYALSRLGLRTGWIGGLNTSPMGRLIANHARAVGMDVSHAVTRKYDGVG